MVRHECRSVMNIKDFGERVRPLPEGWGPPCAALFDFDGTLSLIREGWTEILVKYSLEILDTTGTSETAEQLEAIVREFLMRQTGKPTRFQLIELAAAVRERGMEPLSPEVYEAEYQRRLAERVGRRREALRLGKTPPDCLLVPGTRNLLEQLRGYGVTLYLASGTEETAVVEEARLLGLTDFFEARIYGAEGTIPDFSKAKVIHEIILRRDTLDGRGLLGFGDGFVEIRDVVTAGGVAIAVASDEQRMIDAPESPSSINGWKRLRLIEAGAHHVIPDYCGIGNYIDSLFE